jgi:hypothetical protein
MPHLSRVADLRSWGYSAHVLHLYLAEVICACEQCYHARAMLVQRNAKNAQETAAVPSNATTHDCRFSLIKRHPRPQSSQFRHTPIEHA